MRSKNREKFMRSKLVIFLERWIRFENGGRGISVILWTVLVKNVIWVYSVKDLVVLRGTFDAKLHHWF